MFRTSFLACAVALPLGLIGWAAAASAHTNLDIKVGVPHYYGHHRGYDRGYGWHDGYRYPRFRYGYYGGDGYVAAYHDRLSCGAARRIVREHGFYHVLPRDCYGKDYAFDAVRNGYRMMVFVNSYTGEVWKE